MRRREFITLLSGAAAWPLAARAQQVWPTIGYLDATSLAARHPMVAAFHRGLKETGYIDGENVAIEYQWAEGRYDRLTALATNLVARRSALIVAGQLPATLAAKAATSTIPIVFANGNDPVKYGLVASLNRPGGNVTGVSFLNNVVAARQLELLHEIAPKAVLVGFLVNPNNPNAESDARDVQMAANVLSQKLLLGKASTPEGIEAAFAKLAQERIGALFVHADAFFSSRHEQLAALTTRYGIPAVFYSRDFVTAGGLMSYGGSRTDAYRLAGIYAGRILQGREARRSACAAVG